MKNLIKKYWKVIIIAGLALLLLFTVYLSIQRIQVVKSEQLLEKAKYKNMRASLIDSVQSANYTLKIKEIDSLKLENIAKINTYKVSLENYKKVVELYKNAAKSSKKRADSLAIAKPECDDVAKAYISVIDSLNLQNISLDSINIILDSEAELYSRNWYLTEQQLKLAQTQITQKDSLIVLKDKLIYSYEQKKVSWWSKNKFWVGFGLGYATGIGTTYLVK